MAAYRLCFSARRSEHGCGEMNLFYEKTFEKKKLFYFVVFSHFHLIYTANERRQAKAIHKPPIHREAPSRGNERATRCALRAIWRNRLYRHPR